MKLHAAMILMYNQTDEQLELSKAALASLQAQDIGPMQIMIINNGSTQPTREWLAQIPDRRPFHYEVNRSPVEVFNRFADMMFSWGFDEILAISNDVVLPPNAYRLMAEWPRGLVTASQTGERNFPLVETAHAVNECTPMPICLFRKWAFDALVSRDGFFYDEGFFNYASDCDLALRMSASGIHGIQLDLPYYHYCSASWRMLPAEEGKKMTDQADRDREYFRQKWGFTVESAEYPAAAQDLQFRAVPKLRR